MNSSSSVNGAQPPPDVAFSSEVRVRVWLVIALLAVLVGVTLTIRTLGGWKPTELERLEIFCDRRSAVHCTLLGLRLLEGNPDAGQTQRGLERLERGCTLGDANGCYLHGSNALSLRAPDASAVAAMAFAKGCAFESFVDLRFLNNPPPTDATCLRLLELAAKHFERARDSEKVDAADALFSVARLSGRAADALCERAARTLIELEPKNPDAWYRYGLFLKTRGRFAEGVTANQRAAELSEKESEAVTWNLGICATGARQGELALDLWRKKLGAKLELASNGLPTGSWHDVKVRLAGRPLAARTSSDDSPGEEETVWIQRLSPCHGMVVSPTAGDLAADYGDLVLFDGAAITTQTVEGKPVHVFPHLVTLERGRWQIFRFAASGLGADGVETINDHLGESAFLYSHTDSVIYLCRECDEAGRAGEVCGHRPPPSAGDIRGKLCVRPGTAPNEVDAALAAAIKKLGGTWLSPALATTLGDRRRAAREQERLDRLEG